MMVSRNSEREGRVIDRDSGRLDGEEEAGRLLLMHSVASQLRPLSARAGEQGSAPLHHLRQRGRRQVDPDRPPALRRQAAARRPAGGARRPTAPGSARRAAISTSRCWSTASRPSASRASPSTSPIASLRPTSASSSSPTRPGHEQYTRNMATGASTADLAIIVADVSRRAELLTQTRRHTYIVTMLGIRHIVLAVNKMDLVGYSQSTFEAYAAKYREFAKGLGVPEVRMHPDLGAARRQCRQAELQHAVVSGPALLPYAGDGRAGARRRKRTCRHAGAMGQPAQLRVSRVLGHAGRRRAQASARGSRRCRPSRRLPSRGIVTKDRRLGDAVVRAVHHRRAGQGDRRLPRQTSSATPRRRSRWRISSACTSFGCRRSSCCPAAPT